MKTICVFVLELAMAGWMMGNDAPPLPTGAERGRFQVVTGTILNSNSEPEATVFRIDTSTGQVWLYENRSIFGQDGKVMAHVNVWTVTNEPGGEIDAMQQQNSIAWAKAQQAKQAQTK